MTEARFNTTSQLYDIRFPFRIIDCGFDAVSIWGHGKTPFGDFFMTSGKGTILSFGTKAEAKEYVMTRGYEFKDEDATLDCLVPVVGKGGISDCELALNRWNAFGDAAHSIKKVFIGDEQDSFMSDVYSKLFAGANLPSVIDDHEPYVPTWKPGELIVVASVLDEGHALLREGLGLDPLPPLEGAPLQKALEQIRDTTVVIETQEESRDNLCVGRLVAFSVGEERRYALLDVREDSFLSQDKHILSFLDADAATAYAMGLGMELDRDIVRLNLSPECQEPGLGASSAKLAATWEVMSQVAYALDAFFSGDFVDGIIDVCLRDLRAEGEGGPYDWTAADLLVVYYVLNEGWGLIAEALGFSENTYADAISVVRCAQHDIMDKKLMQDSSSQNR